MGKTDLAPLLIAIVFIELGMWIFAGVTTPTSSISELIISLINPTATSFWTWLMSNITGVITIAGGIAIGTLLATKNEIALWAAFTAVFGTYAFVFFAMAKSLITEFQHFYSLNAGASLLAILIMLPIVILYVVTILKFWKGLE